MSEEDQEPRNDALDAFLARRKLTAADLMGAGNSERALPADQLTSPAELATM